MCYIMVGLYYHGLIRQNMLLEFLCTRRYPYTGGGFVDAIMRVPVRLKNPDSVIMRCAILRCVILRCYISDFLCTRWYPYARGGWWIR